MLLFDRRRLPWFLLPYVGVGGGGFLIIQAATEGEFFRHLVTYNRNAMDWEVLGRVLRNEIWFFYRWWICGLLAAGGCLWAALARSPEPERPSGAAEALPPRHARGVIAFYALGASLSLATFAKVGSAANYALEPLAAWSLLGMEILGGLLCAVGGVAGRRRFWARLGTLSMGLALVLHVLRIDALSPVLFSSPAPAPVDLRIGRAVLEMIREAEGEVLSEFPVFTILSGKDVVHQPFIMSQLAREGVWDEEPFNQQIREQRFSLIVTTQDLRDVERGVALMRYTEAMALAILGSYRLEHTVGAGARGGGLGMTFYVWVPLEERPAGIGGSRLQQRLAHAVIPP
jgi:hypothetical protein